MSRMRQAGRRVDGQPAGRYDPAMDPAALLAQATFFKGMSEESRRALAKLCSPVEARRRAVLFREGDPGQAMYLLVRGHVRLHKTSPDGREVVIKVVRPGEAFAEAVLFESPRYPVTGVALTDAFLLKLLKRDIHRLLDSRAFRNDFIGMLIGKQRYLAGRIAQLGSQDVERRFIHFLREQYGEQEQIEVRISKKELAAAVGATPETFSRLIQRLRDAGTLKWQGRTLRLKRGFWKRS